ncbi:hypothetical protein ACX3O0_05690 [Homoserinimonas sp. A447]
MLKSSTKLITTAAASILGVALAGGAAYAATGSLTVADAPGQVLKVSGVGPASAHASETAMANADANAKGLFGSDVSADAEATVEADADATVEPTVAPVEPRVAAENASTVKGSETGQSVSAWAHEKDAVEAVDPAAAVSVDVSVGVDASANGRG